MALVGQNQTSYVVAGSDGIHLLDGSDIKSGQVTDMTVHLLAFAPDQSALFQVHFMTAPDPASEIRFQLTTPAAGSHVLLQGTTLKDDQGNLLATEITEGQTLQIYRCGGDRIYRLDTTEVYRDLVDPVAPVIGSMIIEKGAGELLQIRLDSATVSHCELVTTALEEIQVVPGLAIYPNPSDGNVWFELEHLALDFSAPIDMHVINAMGVVVFEELATAAAPTRRLGLGHLPPGPYYCRVRQGPRHWVGRVILQ